MSELLVGAGLALVVTATLEPILIPWLRHHQIIDHPGHRTSHERPTVRGGGIAVVIAIVIGYFVANPPSRFVAICLALVAFGLVGLLEDVRGVRILHRLTLQLILSGACVAVLTHEAGLSLLFAVIAIAAGTLFVLGFVNVFNFMDGINGISALQSIVIGLTYVLLARHAGTTAAEDLALCIVAAAAAFLPYNVPSARAFLGDTGSYALGGGLAAIAVALGLDGVPIEAIVAPLGVYFSDAGWTLLRRIHRGEPWHLPHRTHTYQQLTDVGLTHVQVAALTALLTAAVAGLGAVSLTENIAARAVADCAGALLLVAYLALPWWYRRRRHVSPSQGAAGEMPRTRSTCS